ncbi:RNA polymerase factor sigma-54 [Gudongella sp. DL1XJH-153]|uniref:RNA polymerase factor sigma-54 n=1 Tax=Gudongella sp. DL1XJH-153 TaxID=3409804 RepID=UPI003BB5769D
MRLNYDLTLEQSQKLIMTPELRQAIQLLQYTSLELNSYLKKEMEENPLLELEAPLEDNQSMETLKEEKDIDWKEFLESYDDISYRSEVDRNKKEYSFENFVSYTPSLKDFLIEQLNMISLGVAEYRIADYIIQNINSNGYLDASISDMASQLEVSEEEVEVVLAVIQVFEPYGVGARSLKECLLIQIREEKDYLLKRIINDHLEDIASNKIGKIAKELEVSTEKVQEYVDAIRCLEPKPGRTFRGDGEDTRYITPDASIEEIDGEYVIFINDVTGPRLSINKYYRSLLKDGGDTETTEFLQDKLNSAMWLIKSIEQRRQTLYKVVESILKYQKEFLIHGEKRLVPLTLKDVAEDIQMHESTISRATNGKYVQTPRGVFELKYFFTTGLSGESGEVSATSVKSIIKGIIDTEDQKKPLSDQHISNILKERGMEVSRRTIAKYRDELKIPSSSRRRRY